MRSNLKLVVNNPHNKIEEKHFFEKDELKIILDLYAKMVSEGSWKDYGLKLGFKYIESAPLVRSSFIAEKGYRACYAKIHQIKGQHA